VDLLFDLNRDNGTTLILVTHDQALGGRCERVLSMSDGRLAEVVKV
jgi:putative ABC transport system ATP-binding protein